MIVRHRRNGSGAAAAWPIALTAIACLAAAAHADDGADDRAVRHGTWYSLGLLSGSVMPDAGFADYQWATLPRAAWGAQAFAGRGALAGGLRFWRSQTTQQNALPGETLVSAVHLTSLDAVGRVRLTRVFGTDVLGSTSVGRLRITYAPDRIAIDTGGGSPIEVRFEPIDEWTAGAGLALQRSLAQQWSAGLEIDRRMFRMDTAHRNGNAIEYRRETFGDWSARFELAWRRSPR